MRDARTGRLSFGSVAFVGLCISAVLLAALSGGRADEKEVTLSFNLPAGKTFYYKASSQMNRNFRGVDVLFTLSIETNMSLVERDEEGMSKVSFDFLKSKASVYYGGELSEMEAPFKLDGKKAVVTVDKKADVKDVSKVPGAAQAEGILKAWFLELPEKPVKVGDSWEVEILEEDPEAEEGTPPKRKGVREYKFKKIEEKEGIEVAVLETKTKIRSYSTTAEGYTDTETKGKSEVKVALDGGYIVETKGSSDTKGKTVTVDEFTGEEEAEDMMLSMSFEAKLEKVSE